MSTHFERWEIVPAAEGDYELILYVSPEHAEFARELGEETEAFARRQIPAGKKVKRIKVMVGTMLMCTLPFTGAFSGTADAAADHFNIGYLYAGNTDSFIRYVDRTQGALQVASPSYFDLNADGSLRLTRQLDEAFVTAMHQRGLQVVPFLSNHWDRELGRAALANREALTTQIATAVSTYNLDGVNVDIENVTDADREAYTDLVRLLRAKLPAGKEVSVAVAANPNGWTKGWHGSYDYPQLAQHADYLMIMAYDETWQGSPLAGPVASIQFVERSIQYALRQQVPPEKLVLGLPFYGRYWVSGHAIGGFGIPGSKVTEMLNRYDAITGYNPQLEAAFAHLTIKDTDPPTTINGSPATPGTYTIYYENERSIQAKIDLAKRYNLKGTGEWSLGQEDPTIWSHFNTALNAPVGQLVNVTVPSWQRQTETGIGVLVDGAELTFDVMPYISTTNRTMVPLRGIFESLGATVTWDEANGRITATKGDSRIELTVGSDQALVNGRTVTLDSPAVIRDSRTMIPLRFVSEALGATVFWDERQQAVLIQSDRP